jgi:hypothetical protein
MSSGGRFNHRKLHVNLSGFQMVWLDLVWDGSFLRDK